MRNEKQSSRFYEPEWVGKILRRRRRGVGRAAFDQSRLVCTSMRILL